MFENDPIFSSAIQTFAESIKALEPPEGYTEEQVNRIEKMAETIIPKVTYDLADAMIPDLKAKEPDKIKEMWGRKEQVRTNIRQIWGHAFDLLGVYIEVAEETVEMFRESVASCISTEDRYLAKSLFLLHHRGCEVAFEALTLLYNGYLDGAYARWRTLHEIFIIAEFISKSGNDVAERYLAYDIVDTYNEIRPYQNSAKKNNYEPLTPEEIVTVETEFKATKSRFGTDFADNYGWAWPGLSQERQQLLKEKRHRPTFADIMDETGFTHWKPYYKLASQRVHSGPKSVLRSRPDPVHVSDCLAITLGILTATMIRIFPGSHLMTGLIILGKYREELRQALEEATKEGGKERKQYISKA